MRQFLQRFGESSSYDVGSKQVMYGKTMVSAGMVQIEVVVLAWRYLEQN